MKVAYIVPSLANKGPIIVVRDLVQEMVKHGHECTVFYFDDIKEILMECPMIRMQFKKMDLSNFDVVHSHGLRPDLFVFLFKPFRSNTKFITTLHNYIYKDLKYQYNYLISAIFGSIWMSVIRRHNKIVTLSKDAIKYYSGLLPLNKLEYAYNTRIIDDATLTKDEQALITEFKGFSKLIGVNAILTARKGVDIVIKALPHMKNYKLFIVGDGKERTKLENLAKQLDVSDKVYFARYIKDAHRFIPFYDVYAMPSRSEGFGLSILEAIIHKKPVVVSDIPIFRELLNNDECAFFELENIQSFIDAVNLAYNNNIIQNALKSYLIRFSPDTLYEKYISIYAK